MDFRRAGARPAVGRLFAALAYAASLALVFTAALLTATHARDAFTLLFLPGVLLATLAPCIWAGSRSAMALAVAVAAVLALLVSGSALNWRPFLPLPLVFGLLAGAVLAARPDRAPERAPPPGAIAEVFAALVYFAGLLAAFMAPFNHVRHFGWPGFALYAALVGVAAGVLSAAIWRGALWAMAAAFGLALAHWIALALVDPAWWRDGPNIAAAAAAGLLTLAFVAMRRPPPAPVQNGDDPTPPVDRPSRPG
jgi:hypothetical protein